LVVEQAPKKNNPAVPAAAVAVVVAHVFRAEKPEGLRQLAKVMQAVLVATAGVQEDPVQVVEAPDSPVMMIEGVLVATAAMDCY
jgi:hypothetical protein